MTSLQNTRLKVPWNHIVAKKGEGGLPSEARLSLSQGGRARRSLGEGGGDTSVWKQAYGTFRSPHSSAPHQDAEPGRAGAPGEPKEPAVHQRRLSLLAPQKRITLLPVAAPARGEEE
jgi:hypothetical protein